MWNMQNGQSNILWQNKTNIWYNKIIRNVTEEITQIQKYSENTYSISLLVFIYILYTDITINYVEHSMFSDRNCCLNSE